MARQAVTELEVDAVAADVLNHNDLSEGGMNPGLKVLVGFPSRISFCFIGSVGGREREAGQAWYGGVLAGAIFSTKVPFLACFLNITISQTTRSQQT